MLEKIASLWPEITLLIAACAAMVVGLSRDLAARQLTSVLSGVALLVAGLLAVATTPEAPGVLPHLPVFVKVTVCVVGLLLVMLLAGTPDRAYEAAVARGQPFDPLRSNRAEFFALLLFSLTGVMLCAGAEDLIWLFLALELTSLPTYVMVAMSTTRQRSLEASVKYFFLGALGAAIFLYGFALLYGATGSTNLAVIRDTLDAQARAGGLNALAIGGLVLSILGICFKIAAVPMHFYTPDVYQGASSAMAAALAFIPKTAGFVSLILITASVGWTFGPERDALPEGVHGMLWIIAVLTMTVGNTLALVQRSVKRILAYSSIAHSGYMLVGLIAGPGSPESPLYRNGLAAVLFYLMAYGVMNLGAFAVLSCLERRGETVDGEPDEPDTVDDLKGLCRTRPALGWTLVLSSVSLLGLPPLLGFFGKLPLFTAGISAGEIALVLILGLNSAIAAVYYLRLASAALLEPPVAQPSGRQISESPFASRRYAALASAGGVIVLALAGNALLREASQAATYQPWRAAERAEHVRNLASGEVRPATSSAATMPTPSADAH